MSSVLVGGFFTTEPPGKPSLCFLMQMHIYRKTHIFGSAHVSHVRNRSVGNFNLIWGKPRIEEILSRIFQRRVF